MNAGIHVERVPSLDDLRSEWNAMAYGRSVFATWEWTDAWWRHFGRGRELLLYACRSEDGRLAAILPLYRWRSRPLAVIRFLGHGPGDELGPVCAPGAHAEAAAGLLLALDGLEPDAFVGEQLPGEERWPDLLGGTVWRREANPTVRAPDGGWEGWLAGRSANFREQLRRRSRTLDRRGARFRLADEPSLEGDLDALFSLHQARWGAQRTAFEDSPFHREVARTTLARGWLRLWLLELDGLPVAAWHGFQVGPVASYYQAGRDPGCGRLSVGFVLLAHSLRAAIEEGASEYRFGRGAEEFKYRFTDLDPGLESVVVTGTPVGRAAVVTARTARGARRRAIGAAGWARSLTTARRSTS